MKRIVITGASGFIGTKLVAVLRESGYDVVTLGRGPSDALRWDYNSDAPPEAFESADAVVHLAGEPVAQRWSPEVKVRIRDSRVLSTERLIHGISLARNRPKALVCASAVGYYGDRGNAPLAEDAAPGRGFLADVCRQWEAKADLAESLGLRVAKVRTGVVLGENGGALKPMLPAFKAFLGGRLASGAQWMPWIHLDDIVGIFQHAIEHPVSGPLNGAAPGIVTNRKFTAQLAGALHRPAFLPVPRFALHLLLGEMAEVTLASQRVLPVATLASGYTFRYPDLAAALASLKL
jgi:uncharacterized protein (TIGR01777 family)